MSLSRHRLDELEDRAVVERSESSPDLGEGQVLPLKLANQAQPREVARSIGGSWPDPTRRGQDSLGDVVADRPRRDVGEVGEVLERELVLGWHALTIHQNVVVSRNGPRLGFMP